MKISKKVIIKQYKKPSNLESRCAFQEKFSTNKYGWYKWVFDHFDFAAQCKILELGCGLGTLWLNNQNRIPKNWQITLSDFSLQMLDKTKQELKNVEPSFNFLVTNSDKIPFTDNTFDVVIANHLLYLVPDIEKTLIEIKRVIKPGGKLVASTNGDKNMKELADIIGKNNLPLHRKYSDYSFCLNNGQSYLSPLFSKIKIFRYEDALLVTQADTLITYLLSTNEDLTEEQKNTVQTFFSDYLKNNGQLRITKDTGMFIAQKE